jgi:hypothetical protein
MQLCPLHALKHNMLVSQFAKLDIDLLQPVCRYHILLLLADGQVTRESHIPATQLSKQEKATVDAIVQARCVHPEMMQGMGLSVYACVRHQGYAQLSHLVSIHAGLSASCMHSAECCVCFKMKRYAFSGPVHAFC